jgi:uncharacterized protein YecT (DUF1311 family)
MKHRISSLHLFPPVHPLFVLAAGLILIVLQGHPSFAAGVRKTEGPAAVKPNVNCDKAPTALDQLICLEPSLAALDAALGPAFRDYLDRTTRPADRDARATDQRLWLDWRTMACPAAVKPQPPAAGEGAGSEVAVACLSRIYEQRLAVLRVEGAGTKLCDDLERDITASFLGHGLFVNPLGEREIGFVPVPGLGHRPAVRRADIDAYNLGTPFPILQWISNHDGAGLPTAEYRAFASPKNC